MTNRTDSTPRRLACSRCNTEFACQLSGACWCMEEPYRLPMPTQDGSDCLCPDCLRSLAAAQTESSALHMERAGKVLEQQTKILLEQMKQDGENNRAQLANDIRVLLGEIAAKSQDTQQRQQLYEEFIKLNHVQAHEAALQAVEHQHQATQATQQQQAAALQQQQATPTPESRATMKCPHS